MKPCVMIHTVRKNDRFNNSDTDCIAWKILPVDDGFEIVCHVCR